MHDNRCLHVTDLLVTEYCLKVLTLLTVLKNYEIFGIFHEIFQAEQFREILQQSFTTSYYRAIYKYYQ